MSLRGPEAIGPSSGRRHGSIGHFKRRLSDKSKHRESCGVALACDILMKRWTLLLVMTLRDEPRRFSELRSSLSGISANMLTTRLRQLEEDGVLKRLRTEGDTRYTLTSWGRELDPALRAFIQWQAASPVGFRSITCRN